MEPPLCSAASLPIGLVAEGQDHNLYYVTCVAGDHCWELFQKAELRLSEFNEYEYVVDTTNVTFPDIVIPVESNDESEECEEKTAIIPVKIRTRKASAYNDFVRERMSFHAANTKLSGRDKLKMIAEEWKSQKNVNNI
jgi:hypothetical protein